MDIRGRLGVHVVLIFFAIMLACLAVVWQATSRWDNSFALSSNGRATGACVRGHGAACALHPEVDITPVGTTAVGGNNPLGGSNSPGAQLLTESQALDLAGADASRPARAVLLSYKEVGQFDRGLGENGLVNPDRKVWLVTVHGDFVPAGALDLNLLPHSPTVVHVISMVIDAETGIKTDVCSGCDDVK